MKEIVSARSKYYKEFVKSWLEGWNKHSIEMIMSHYADDVVVKSPFLAATLKESGGTVSGSANLRKIYTHSFIKYPHLKFELIKAFASTESVVIHYKSVENLLAAETFLMNEAGKAKLVLCHYSV